MLASFDLNTRQFLSLQSSQQMRMIKLRVPFLFSLRAVLTMRLDVAMESCSSVADAMDSQPVQADAVTHTCLEKGQVQKRCSEVSRLRMQNGQKYPFGYPLLWSLSLHHSRFSNISQKKTFSFPGAHTFHIFRSKLLCSGGPNCMR